jgi:outer membrane protein insertion porin family
MRISNWLGGPLLAGVLMGAPVRAATVPFEIGDIRLEGLQRISAGTVFSYLPVQVGDTLDRQAAQSAIRELFKTGFFQDVRLARQGPVLIVEVRERPAISSIRFEGNRDIETEALEEALAQIGMAEGQVFDRSLLVRVEQELRSQYFARGKYGVHIESTVTPLERNRVGVDIRISEGKAARIHAIRIVGNAAFSDDVLLDDFTLGTTGFFSFITKNDQYSKPKLAADLETLRSYYLDRGYLNFAITSTQVSLTPDKRDVYITINVEEGDRFTVKEVGLAGDLVVPEAELAELIQVQPGSVFSRKVVTEAAERVSDRLGREGYAFANVNPVPKLDEAAREVALTFFVDPGKRVYVRRIGVSGNAKTSDEVLRREMRQMEGARFDTEKVKLSRTRLERLGYFEEVNLETPAVPGTTDQVDVDYSVVERPSGNLLAGVGFSQSSGILFNASVSQQNFLGSGKSVRLAFNNSDVNTVYSFGFDNPYWTVDGVSRGFDLFFRETDAGEANLADFAFDTLGGRINFGIPVNESDRIRFGVGVERIDINTTASTPVPFIDFLDRNGLIGNADTCTASPSTCRTDGFDQFKLTAGWSRDTRDRALFPSRGMRQSLSLESAVPGSDLEFYKLEYRNQWYHPFTDDFILVLKGNVGFGDGLGGTTALPFFENFYSGGVRSVRGFEDNTLGPRDPATDDPIGGNLELVGNVELVLPIMPDNRAVRFSTFFDVGNVYDTDEDVDPDDLRYSAGVGVSWLSPLGALYFSLAYPIKSEDGDDRQPFQFTLGAGL